MNYRNLLTLMLFACPLAHGGEEISERQDADPGGRVEITNIAGEISVTGWGEDAIEVTGTLGRGVERLDFTRDNELTVIEVVYPENGGNSGGSQLNIKIPEGSELEVIAVSAPIHVRGVCGRQRLKTVSGDVITEAFGSDIEAESVSGDLSVSGSSNMTHTLLKTISGTIETDRVSGELEASTISGRIEADAGTFSRARLNTTNGRISIEGGLTPNGRYDLSTTNGRIDVLLDHDQDLDVDAQTFSGTIDNCFGIEPAQRGYSPERTLRFQDGEANRTIRIRSMVGRIDICSVNRAG